MSASKAKEDPEVDAELLRLSLEVNRISVKAASPERTWTAPFFLVVLALITMAIGYKVLSDHRPTSSGLQRFPGESADDEADDAPKEHLSIPGAEARPIVIDSGVVPSVADQPPRIDTAPITLPSEKKNDAPVQAPKNMDLAAKTRALGEMTLAIFPDGATVLEGNQALGNGLMVKLQLPAGTHLLTLVGPDSKPHKVSVKINPGKNPPRRLKLSELE